MIVKTVGMQRMPACMPWMWLINNHVVKYDLSIFTIQSCECFWVMVSDYDNEFVTILIITGLKNFKPKINLNHNIFSLSYINIFKKVKLIPTF